MNVGEFREKLTFEGMSCKLTFSPMKTRPPLPAAPSPEKIFP